MERFNQHRLASQSRVALFCLGLLCFAATPLQAKEAAAKVQFVVGTVSATSAEGKLRQLQKGDRIYAGDTIKSGANGAAQLMYRDRSRMAVRVNTEFIIQEYRYDEANKGVAKSVLSLLGGALRSVSGLIASFSPQNVTVNTPLATIGIRGTDFEIVHITAKFDGGKNSVDPGTYNKVYAGGTTMKTNRGNLNLDINQVGFVGGTKGKVLKPVQIKELPKVIRTQLINKIPLQAKTLPKKQEQSESRKSTGTKANAQTNRTKKKARDSGKRVETKVGKTIGNSIKNGATGALPNVTQVPSPAGPVPVPLPNVGTLPKTKVSPKTTVPTIPIDTLIKVPMDTSLQKAGVPKTKSKINITIPVTTIAPKVKIPTVSIPKTVPRVTVPATVPKVTLPVVTPKVKVPAKAIAPKLPARKP